MSTKAIATDDSPKSVKARMDAVYKGQYPEMPGLNSMTKKQMAKELQSIWTLLDETGVQRRNETSPQHRLTVYGRVLGAIINGPLVGRFRRTVDKAPEPKPKDA